MNKTRVLLCSAAVMSLSAATAANAGTLWVANLSGANEVPANAQPFSGTGFLILNDTETVATVRVNHNVNVTLTGGHIHRAPAGVNGPVIFPFPDPVVSPIGPLTWAIPTAEVANLKAAGLYVNIHTSVNPGGVIRDQLRRFLLAPSAANGSQLALANALDVSAGYNADLDTVLMGLAVAPATSRAPALNDLSANTVYAQGRQAIESMVGFQDTLFGHADDLARAPAEGMAGFLKVGDTFGKRDAQAGQAGSKISRPSIMGGVDYALSDNMRGGIAVGYADGKDKFRGGAGRTQAKTTSLQAYVTSASDSLVFTASAGYGWAKFDTRRNLSSIGRTATASPDGKVWSLAAKLSAPMALSGNATISPYGRFDVQHARIDGYSEAGAGAAGLVVPKHTDKNAAIEAGAAISLPLGPDAGAGSAWLQAGWRYLVEDGKDTFATNLSGSPVAFQTGILSPGKNSARVSAGLTGRLGENLTGTASYNGVLSKRTTNHALELRLTLRM